MFALPVVVCGSAERQFVDGLMFSLPAELKTKHQLDFYATKVPSGWSRCPQRYWVFAKSDSEGVKYVLPGLMLEGEERPKKKYHQQQFRKASIEEYCNALISERDRMRAARDEELGVLVHDLRALSAAIYNNGVAAKMACEFGNSVQILERIESVIAAQTMLSFRIDYLDFQSSGLAAAGVVATPVFKKVDKVVRCVRSKAADRGVTLQLSGQSFGFTRGPQVFELIPYAVMDNALKYAPQGSRVEIHVSEDDSTIGIVIESHGPKIDPDEMEAIFDKGYRGRHAETSRVSGRGIGLNMTREILGQFGGSISVRQSAQGSLFFPSFFLTAFVITVPIDRSRQ